LVSWARDEMKSGRCLKFWWTLLSLARYQTPLAMARLRLDARLHLLSFLLHWPEELRHSATSTDVDSSDSHLVLGTPGFRRSPT
jgi:hypothetical protein